MDEFWLKMKKHFLEIGFLESEYDNWFCDTVTIAQAIVIYSHREQYRLNGEDYYVHPMRCMLSYQRMMGITNDGSYSFNEELIDEYQIPFRGVQETCLLHDVLEDTETTMEDIERIYVDCGFETYYNLYIKLPLLLITHEKSEPYPIYIERLSENPVAALCKLLDLIDNMNFLGLDTLGEKELNRTIGYAVYAKTINDRWHFLENSLAYKKSLSVKR